LLTVEGGNITVTNLIVSAYESYSGLFSWLDSTSKTFTAENVTVGGACYGTFTQTGGTCIITGTLKVGGQEDVYGIYNLNGGRLRVGAIEGSNVGELNFNGGKLSVDNSSVPIVVKNGATLSPGDSPGTTIENGNITFESGGMLDIEIGGLNQGAFSDNGYDWLHVIGGDVLFESGSILKLTQWNGFLPADGNYFDVITWDSDKTFTDQGLSFQPWDLDFTWAVNGSSLRVTYDGEGPVVPEPATVVSMLSGLFMLAYRRLLKRVKR
jgi:hypothetical protein